MIRGDTKTPEKKGDVNRLPVDEGKGATSWTRDDVVLLLNEKRVRAGLSRKNWARSED